MKTVAGGQLRLGVRRLPRLARSSSARRPPDALVALAAVVAAGVALRVLFLAAYRPALLGFPDSLAYLQAASGDLFEDALRPAGYPLFVRLLGPLGHSLPALIGVQHLIGIATALVWWTALRSQGARWPVALAPAAAVLLSGQQLFVEHAPLSEPLFEALLAIATWCTLRSRTAYGVRWPALTGAIVGAAATVRLTGLFLVPVFAGWAIWQAPPGWRSWLARAAVVVSAFVAVLGAYVAAQRVATGYTGLTRAGEWNLYGKVATFADCTRFTPPAGTEGLCESTPPARRHGTGDYLFDPEVSPAVKLFGVAPESGIEASRKVGAFARAAILAEPGAYAEVVARDLVRFVDPSRYRRPGNDGAPPADLTGFVLTDPGRQGVAETALRESYAGMRHASADWAMRLLRSVDRLTRTPAALMLLLVVLAFAAPFVVDRRDRPLAALLAAVAFAGALAPAMTNFYSARYALPIVAPLWAAAALAVWALAARVWRRVRGRSS